MYVLVLTLYVICTCWYVPVWKRLADRFASVVADTSMITLSTENAAHFHDMYIDGKGNAKMTSNPMKMLMLTLPFMVRDLIAPEVIISEYVRVCTCMYLYVLGCTRMFLYVPSI